MVQWTSFFVASNLFPVLNWCLPIRMYTVWELPRQGVLWQSCDHTEWPHTIEYHPDLQFVEALGEHTELDPYLWRILNGIAPNHEIKRKLLLLNWLWLRIKQCQDDRHDKSLTAKGLLLVHHLRSSPCYHHGTLAPLLVQGRTGTCTRSMWWWEQCAHTS